MSKQPSWVSTVHSTVMASGLAGLHGRGWHMSHTSLGCCTHQHTYLASEGHSVPRPQRAPAIPTLLLSSSWEMGVTWRQAWPGAAGGTAMGPWVLAQCSGTHRSSWLLQVLQWWMAVQSMSVQVLCSVGHGVAGRGNVSLPTVNTALRAPSLYPRS